MTLPQQIKSWRKRRGLTQASAAAQLGVPIDTLQNWEAGRNAPRGLGLSHLLQKISMPVRLEPPATKKCRPARRGESNQTTSGTRARTRGGKTRVTNEKPKR